MQHEYLWAWSNDEIVPKKILTSKNERTSDGNRNTVLTMPPELRAH